MKVNVHRHYSNTIVELDYTRSTPTMFICEDDKGTQYKFRRYDGTTSGSNKRNCTYSLTTESLGFLKDITE